MERDTILVLLYSVAWFLTARLDNASASVSVCWDSEERCIISAQLHRGASWNQIDLPIQIDCQQSVQSLETSFQHDPKELYLLHRFEHVQNVTLNGCHSQLNSETYGYEFLPNCGTIHQTTLERFHGDNMKQFQCPTRIEMEVLIFRNNEIAAFYSDAFANLVALREIYFKQNSVRHINRSAFESMPKIELIHVEQEECLKIKEADFFERTGVADLRLIDLKNIHSELLQHLPDSIRLILVADMKINDRQLHVKNPLALRNVSVINCDLDAFALDDPYATVVYLNLSKNAITNFVSGANETHCTLETLDLSENKLEYLRSDWLRNLQCLQVLALQGNNLMELSIHDLLLAVPTTSYIDLRDNQLEVLGDSDAELQIDCDRTRISVDRNPWNCLWLLNFTHTHPEKFRIFQYRKFISKINVNGLECRAQKTEISNPNKIHHIDEMLNKEEDLRIPSTSMNLSTYTLIYGSNRESKRSQRSEALIIVFMLPLGIAILFLLLYMWIYCQKMFHLSYYRNIPIIGKTIPIESTEHCELASQMPPLMANSTIAMFGGNVNDYEMPLKGAVSICNCNHVGLEPSENQIQCKKRHVHHITYEEAPNEQPYRLYEEVLGDDQHIEVAQTHPFYDHLTYVEGYQSHMAT